MPKLNLFLVFFLSSSLLIENDCFGRTFEQKQDSINTFIIYFPFSSATLDMALGDNIKVLSTLDSLFAPRYLKTIQSISIRGTSSPEGKSDYNEELKRRRAETVGQYLKDKYPQLNTVPLYVSMPYDNGQAFFAAISNNTSIPQYANVVRTLKEHKSVENQIAGLNRIPSESYTYIKRYLFPSFRSAVACVICFKPESVVEIEPPEKTVDTAIPEMALAPQTETSHFADEKAETVEWEYIKKPLFAVKTNLLFDVLSIVNIEVEVPIGRRWSVAGEWIFPWWLWEKKQRCLQVLSGNLEGRYWLGNRTNREVMTGWYAGVYTGAGLYDLEWETKGYQGEFFVAAGVSAGYAHRISRNLRMEYSIGVGYLKTDYKEYIPKNDGEILSWQKDGRYTWVGPTRAKISLVWMLTHKVKKGETK